MAALNNGWSAVTTGPNSGMFEQRNGTVDEIITGLIQEED
jgi:hypothetical protein